MKRPLLLLAALAAFGCAGIRDLRQDDAPYANPFYAKYLTTGSSLDAAINRTLTGLRATPDSPELHNELGMLLVQKGFPKDAEREFERSVNSDGKYFPAWYNLGLVRAADGQEGGARRAFQRTVKYKPGHAMALFQLGLIEEKLLHTDRAIAYYSKAYTINPALMQVATNPRVLDSKLMDLTLINMYPTTHARKSMSFIGAPSAPSRQTTPAPSPQADPSMIVPPSAPATDPSQQNPNRPPA
ncbi:MAG: tetratricopeptide repeat protein [Acidobacteriota bacterium]